jgi:cytoplasmic iron level regulating protein YaaA (DUF328/UPF0246 family)
MLMVVSPAKTLDYQSPSPTREFTKPGMLKDSAELVELMRGYSPDDLVALMGISHKLGELNAERFLEWSTPFNRKNAKQAVFAFKGDVYTGLEAEQFNEDQLQFAQSHFRILSGLYGLLRPLDLMQPYRLEMGTKVPNERGSNLYEFWGDKITAALNKQLKAIESDVLVNLASNEYFKSVNTGKLNAEIITPVFKDFKNGKYRIVSFYAKKARGMMSAYAISKQLSDVEALKKFNTAGYRYDKSSSTATEWVFLRDEVK